MTQHGDTKRTYGASLQLIDLKSLFCKENKVCLGALDDNTCIIEGGIQPLRSSSRDDLDTWGCVVILQVGAHTLNLLCVIFMAYPLKWGSFRYRRKALQRPKHTMSYDRCHFCRANELASYMLDAALSSMKPRSIVRIMSVFSSQPPLRHASPA